VHNIYIGDGAYRCALAGLSPLILTALGSDINDVFEKGTSRKQRMTAKALLSASYITADTDEILKRCELLVGKPLNLSLFYFGIDLNLFYSRSKDEKLLVAPKELGISLNTRILLSPRRITPKMRHDIVLEAFKKIRDISSVDMILILRRFGSYPVAYEKELREQAEELGIGDHVLWLDKIDYKELPILYSLADVVINIPEQDGLPITVLEASACMTPVITSDLPAYQEFLSEGAYVRVRSGDVEALAKCNP